MKIYSDYFNIRWTIQNSLLNESMSNTYIQIRLFFVYIDEKKFRILYNNYQGWQSVFSVFCFGRFQFKNMRFLTFRYDRFYQFCTDFSKSVFRYFSTIALYRNYDKFSFATFREYRKLENFLSHIWVINFRDCFVSYVMMGCSNEEAAKRQNVTTRSQMRTPYLKV